MIRPEKYIAPNTIIIFSCTSKRAPRKAYHEFLYAPSAKDVRSKDAKRYSCCIYIYTYIYIYIHTEKSPEHLYDKRSHQDVRHDQQQRARTRARRAARGDAIDDKRQTDHIQKDVQKINVRHHTAMSTRTSPTRATRVFLPPVRLPSSGISQRSCTMKIVPVLSPMYMLTELICTLCTAKDTFCRR